MVVTHSIRSPVTAEHVRYIKLGRGGGGASECIANGELGLGFREVPHRTLPKWPLGGRCRATALAWQDQNGRKQSDARIRDFYEADPTTLWITFHEGLLWWAFPRPSVRYEPGPDPLPRRRRAMGSWRSTSIERRADSNPRPEHHGHESEPLSGTLSPWEAVNRTCYDASTVRKNRWLRRRRNSPPRKRTHWTPVRELHWRDFEILVDLIFAASGWRRVGVFGRNFKTDLDLMVEQNRDGRTCVRTGQVKGECAGSRKLHREIPQSWRLLAHVFSFVILRRQRLPRWHVQLKSNYGLPTMWPSACCGLVCSIG